MKFSASNLKKTGLLCLFSDHSSPFTCEKCYLSLRALPCSVHPFQRPKGIWGKILAFLQCFCSSEWIVGIIFVRDFEQQLLVKMVYSEYLGFISALAICGCSHEACDISSIFSLHKSTGVSHDVKDFERH